MSSTNRENSLPASSGELRFAPFSATEDSDLTLNGVTPSRRDWLSELLEGLLPWMVEAVQEVAEEHDPKLLHTHRQGLVPIILKDSYQVEAMYGWYAFAAAKFAARFGNLPRSEWPSGTTDGRKSAIDTLVGVGTGTDQLNTSIDHVETGPVRLIEIASSTPHVSLHLDESAWRESQRSQRKSGLKTIAILSEACSIELVASPSLKGFLEDLHTDWVDSHLTESSKPHTSLYTTSDSVDPQEVFESLQELSPSGGRLRLLKSLPEEGKHKEVRDIRADRELDLSEGTVNRYYPELEEEHGFLSVDRGRHNSVALTPAGRLAQTLISSDGRIHHPQQSRLDDDLTPPPQRDTGVVSGAAPPHPAEVGQPPEVCLGASAEFFGHPRLRRLSLPDCWMTEQELIDRLAGAKCARGVTLVNDRIQEFDDGRVTCLGQSDDEVHVAVQWGGPIPTLVRLGAALLSDTAFDEILPPSRVSPLLSGSGAFDSLRLGRQLGWLSEDEQRYEQLRDRYEAVGKSLIYRLGSRHQSPEIWSQLCAEAHGFLATATNLYDAAGLDLTIHIRLPDTAQLVRDDARYDRFISFLKNTVPKSAAYRGNSAPRMLLEEDGEKLGYRLPVDIDEDDREAELTADWVITGPDVASFREDIIGAIGSVSIRKQVASGSETGIRIPVEVATANTFSNLQRTVERLLARLGRTVGDGLDSQAIMEFYLHALGNVSDSSLTSSPFDIGEALIAADRLAAPDEPITTPTLARSLGVVAPKKIYPWLPPTARKMMRVLFEADVPLKRSEILERSDVSDTSYERHRSTLENAGLLFEEERYRYQASIPGSRQQDGWPSLEEVGDADAREMVLYQKLLSAQIRAHSAGSVQQSRGVSRVSIG